MKSVTLDEAEALLSQPLLCEDAGEWKYDKLQPSMARLECGLMAADRSRSGLVVQLLFSRSPKTKLPEYKFTVFKWNHTALQRVYQLHMNGIARAPKNWHDFAHEHIGQDRVDGSPEWLKWGFDEALDYFLRRTNITFIPPLEDPEIFRLTSS
jgi:hypothetical protein